MNIGCIIQARLGSSRLPRKIILNLYEGKTVLEQVLDRVHQIKGLDRIIVAMPDEPQSLSVDCGPNSHKFYGHSDDVLDRYYRCAKANDLDVIMRITADCPLLDPHVATRILERFVNGRWNFVSNTRPTSTWPDGTDVEVFDFWSLRYAYVNATKPYDREHVTSYMYTPPVPVRCHTVIADKDYSMYKWSVDTSDDLAKVRQIVTDLGPDATMPEIIAWEQSRKL